VSGSRNYLPEHVFEHIPIVLTIGHDESVIVHRTAFRTFCPVPNERPEVRAEIGIAEVARGDHPVDAAADLDWFDVDPRAAVAELLDTVTALTVVIEAQRECIQVLEDQPTERLRVPPLPTPLGGGET
jgi:hypothetical protein